jgi:transcriptional regulator with XRE-family HTH domain
MQLGRKIRELRLRRGMTVQRLADASHLSKGFISQVENDRTSPSLATLHELAAALRTSVSYLVADDEPTPHIVRAAERPPLDIGDETVRVEVLSALPRRNLEMLLLELPPGASDRVRPHSYDGEECILCLEGRVLLRQGEHSHVLETGDSCHYDGRATHTIRNAGEGTARLLVAMTPAAFGQRGREETAERRDAGPVPSPASSKT